MLMSQAEKLGLVTGGEEKVTMEMDLWNGVQAVEIIQLKEVVVTLEGGRGVTVRTPMEVFPKVLEKMYDPSVIMLDIAELCRGGVVQTFSHKGSALFVRHPRRLRQPVAKD